MYDFSRGEWIERVRPERSLLITELHRSSNRNVQVNAALIIDGPTADWNMHKGDRCIDRCYISTDCCYMRPRECRWYSFSNQRSICDLRWTRELLGTSTGVLITQEYSRSSVYMMAGVTWGATGNSVFIGEIYRGKFNRIEIRFFEVRILLLNQNSKYIIGFILKYLITAVGFDKNNIHSCSKSIPKYRGPSQSSEVPTPLSLKHKRQYNFNSHINAILIANAINSI